MFACSHLIAHQKYELLPKTQIKLHFDVSQKSQSVRFSITQNSFEPQINGRKKTNRDRLAFTEYLTCAYKLYSLISGVFYMHRCGNHGACDAGASHASKGRNRAQVDVQRRSRRSHVLNHSPWSSPACHDPYLKINLNTWFCRYKEYSTVSAGVSQPNTELGCSRMHREIILGCGE